MVIDLQRKYDQLRKEGEQSMLFGEGYVVHHRNERHCSIMFASSTMLDTHGTLNHQPPCTRIELRFVSGESIGEGNKDELLRAIQDGRISEENSQPLIEAVQQGRVLWMPKAQGLVVILKKEAIPTQSVDHQLFYTSTQREEAIGDISDHVRKSTKNFLGFARIDARDILAVAAFIAIQLPEPTRQ